MPRAANTGGSLAPRSKYGCQASVPAAAWAPSLSCFTACGVRAPGRGHPALLQCTCWALSTHCSHERQRPHAVDIPGVTQRTREPPPEGADLRRGAPRQHLQKGGACSLRPGHVCVNGPVSRGAQRGDDTAGLAHFLCGPDPAAMQLRGSHTVVRDALCLLFQLGAGRPVVGRLHTDIAGPALGSQLPAGTCAQPPGGPQGDLAVQRRFWS